MTSQRFAIPCVSRCPQTQLAESLTTTHDPCAYHRFLEGVSPEGDSSLPPWDAVKLAAGLGSEVGDETW